MVGRSGWQRVVESARALGLSLLVHVLVALVLILGTRDWQSFQRSMPPIQVSLVDQAPLRTAQSAEREETLRQRREQAERERREREQAEQLAAERERREREEAERRENERQRRERELERQRAEQQERRRLEDIARRREAERQRLEQERLRAEQERERELAELRAQREQAQREREAEERRMQELAERRLAEDQARRAAEEAERLVLAAEQAASEARRATLREEYVSTIRALVTRNWTRPPTTRPGVVCRVRVVQIPGGEIIAAEIVRPCNADDATRRSIIAAVLRVGFLPYRDYESVFAREIDFDFIFNG